MAMAASLFLTKDSRRCDFLALTFGLRTNPTGFFPIFNDYPLTLRSSRLPIIILTMTKETTLILFKPDCIAKGCVGEVLSRFEKAGFSIRGLKCLQLDDALLNEHYAHIADRPFFPELAEFMSSRPVIALALEGENVIVRVRDLLGPTDSTKAESGTIRGDFGKDTMENICHASDSTEAAQAELKRFFKDEEIF